MNLTIKDGAFFIGDQQTQIYSGAIHYFRVPCQYWRDRLEKLKAAGLNTVETYVCWNLHEPKKGVYDFDGDLDILGFLKIAQELGLFVILRPGPYICAEWDLGGFPAWLLSQNVRLRHYDELYLKHVKDWYAKLFSVVKDMQITRGGNIIAMQVENEYGSYSRDKKYLNAVRDIMLELGCEVFMFTADGDMNIMISRGKADGVYQALNFGSKADRAFNCLKGKQDNAPKTCMEFWDGWFDHWTEEHHVRESAEVMKEINTFIEQNINFNLYMFHGGTNFAFTAGANYGQKYQPTTTSYDYNAPLSEWGGYTPLYHDLRAALLKARGIDESELPLPAEPQMQNIGTIELDEYADLRASLPALGWSNNYEKPTRMEWLGQNFGYVWYSTQIQKDYSSKTLYLTDPNDLAYVFVDGKLEGRIWRTEKHTSLAIGNGCFKRTYKCTLYAPLKKGSRLDILIDAMGRVNYGPQIYDYKGLNGARIGCVPLTNWDIRSLPMTDLDKLTFAGEATTAPCFLKGHFKTESQGDCFVHLDGFKKGFVVVNGHNLGRYWSIGPQKALYLPGCRLNNGDNEIIVFEQEGYEAPRVEINSHPNLG